MLLSVCLLGCVTPKGVALSALARELSTPERGEQRFDLQGRPYQQYAEDRYDCLLRHDRLSHFVACMEARGVPLGQELVGDRAAWSADVALP
jgi:hypothetical protein